MNHRCPSTQGYFILSVRQLNTQCFSYRNVLLFLSKKLKLISENVKKKLQSDKFNFIYVCAAKSNKNKKVVYIFSSFHPLIKKRIYFDSALSERLTAYTGHRTIFLRTRHGYTLGLSQHFARHSYTQRCPGLPSAKSEQRSVNTYVSNLSCCPKCKAPGKAVAPW